MTSRAKEQIIERQQPLAVVQSHASKCDFSDPCLALENTNESRMCLVRQEWKENAIKPSRIGINGHDRLYAGVLRRVCDQSILTKCHHNIFLLKLERRHKCTVHHLDLHLEIQGSPQQIERASVGVVLTLIVGEIATSGIASE